MNYSIEDISDNMDDGFLWYSVIDNMEMYRVQVAISSNGAKNVLHIYNQDDESVDDNSILEFVEDELNGEEDTSDKWKEVENETN